MERQRFEESWKDSFKDAEVSPSDSLWTNIELDIEKAEGKVMKKRVLYFKLLAAASVAFAMTFAGAAVYFGSKRNLDPQIAHNTSDNNSANALPSVAGNPESVTKSGSQSTEATENKSAQPTEGIASAERTNKSSNDNSIQKSDDNKKTASERDSGTRTAGTNATLKEQQAIASATDTNTAVEKKSANVTSSVSSSKTSTSADNESKDSDPLKSEIQVAALNPQQEYNAPGDLLLPLSGSLPTIAHLNNPSFKTEKTEAEVDPVQRMMAKMKEEENKYAKADSKEEKKKKENDTERIWTSVGFAAGSFNTMTSGTGQLPAATSQVGFNNVMSNNIVQNQSTAAGKAYSVGISLGGKVTNRWVLQGGLNYMTQSSAYTTNAVVGSADYATFKAASIAEISNAGKSDSRLVNTSSYNVNSSLQYLSVPLQAGYLIVNRNVGLQLNAGVSTDLFLQSTLTPEEGTLEKSTQGNGADSPYRTLNFSGLVGTELSYRFGHRYRVSLNPGLRYPFSSIYKSEISVNATPLTFDVGLRFRYIFN